MGMFDRGPFQQHKWMFSQSNTEYYVYSDSALLAPLFHALYVAACIRTTGLKRRARGGRSDLKLKKTYRI